MNKEPVFLGIYVKTTTGGPGEDVRSRWHVWSLEAGQYLVQEVKPGQESQEPSRQIDSSEFMANFRVHAALSADGKKGEAKAPLDGAGESFEQAPKNIFDDDDEDEMLERRRSTGATYFVNKSAPPPASEAEILVSDPQELEQQMRSDFSLALIRLQSSREQALQSLHKLSLSKGNFRKQHKFMFTDFGTALRRRHLYSLSVRFHERAKFLAPDDEHILFNMARALYDSGKVDKARSCLEEAVAMASDFQAGSDFLAFIDGKNSRRV